MDHESADRGIQGCRDDLRKEDQRAFKRRNCGGKYLDSFIDEANASPDDQIERLCAQQLIQRMETATAALLETNADVLRLQLLLKHHSYTDWLKTSEQWEQLFPESLFVFETSVEISRYSLEE